MDIKEIALKVASELDFSGPIRISPLPDHLYVTFAEALVAEIQRRSEACCWMTPDGEGWRMRTKPPETDVPLGWMAMFTFPPGKTQIEQSVADACAAYLSNRAKPNLEAAQVMDDSVAAIRSGEWKKFRKGE